ncbi:MAG: peptidoglycan bridge formation glycyltransferase FemA/FemB family protein [Anaerolineae bacterium]|nr:peptidoglycan bridge formation glycyltransferase FemA/FemB family protein [Anaerolineae bacterium]
MTIQGQTKTQQPTTEFGETHPLALTHPDYQVRVSEQVEDAAWDVFLEMTPGGHHVQTSLWAQVKASLGWKAVRMIVSHRERIVAGAQFVLRPMPILGSVGYVSKGPVFATKDQKLEDLVFQKMHQVVKSHHVQHLTVQPPDDGERFAKRLVDKGFRPGSMNVAPTATMLLDLSNDLDTLMAAMSRKTRYNVRLSQRKGITVREGTGKDLQAYYQLLSATGQRQNFSPYPEHYFTELWRIFNPRGYVKLFLAEFEGELVSAQLTVPFGKTVINKLSVWSGNHGNRRPNEALQWTVIAWAKSHGYRYYDFEGIQPEAAKAILSQESLPDSLKQTVTSFKLGFKGQVVLFPSAFEYVYNPLFRYVYTKISPKIRKQRLVKRALKHIRTH